MVKQLNGIFRAWLKVDQPDRCLPPIVWGQCIVHLSNPEFSGKILHTSAIIEIAHHKTIKIAESRNNYYALLGPELFMPNSGVTDPAAFLAQHGGQGRKSDVYASAALNADHDCGKCHGTGVYRYDSVQLAVCDLCCKHTMGWWLLEGNYGPNNGRWACKAGCGTIVDAPPLELAFLPRTIA